MAKKEFRIGQGDTVYVATPVFREPEKEENLAKRFSQLNL